MPEIIFESPELAWALARVELAQLWAAYWKAKYDAAAKRASRQFRWPS